MIATPPVDQIDEGCDQRPLAAQTRAGDDNKSSGFECKRLHRARQAEPLGGRGTGRDHAKYPASPVSVPEGGAPHAADAVDVARPIDRCPAAQAFVLSSRNSR